MTRLERALLVTAVLVAAARVGVLAVNATTTAYSEHLPNETAVSSPGDPVTTQLPPAAPAVPNLQVRLQQLQEQRRLCARCDCFALRRDGPSNGTVRVSLDENLDDVAEATPDPHLPATTLASGSTQRPAVTKTAPLLNQVLVINCTTRLLAEELPQWSWPARLSAGELVANETWTEFRGGDLSGVARLPRLPFRLTRLSLADNRLRSVAPRAFANLQALRELDLSHNVIADVPHDAFLGLSALERLNLSRNSLSSRPLSADLFRELGNLSVVSLAHNKIAGDLNGETLPWSGSIRELDLSYNELTSVSAGAWGRLPSVKILDLSHNKLSSLTPDAFLELRSLERLDLSWNALAVLPPGALSGLVALRSLRLSHNALRSIPASTFSPLAALHDLDLSWNSIRPEGLAALEALPASLRSLDLSHNPLGHPEDGVEGQSEGGAQLPPTLEDLSLEQCGLHGLDVRAWGGLHALRRLQLAGNDISVLTDLVRLDALEELNVSSNALTRFPVASLPALRVLDLTHNQLERAPVPHAGSLAVLLLDDNPMTELRVRASASLGLLSAQQMPHLRALPAGAVHLESVEGANGTAPCFTLLLRNNPVLDHVHEDALVNVKLCQLDVSHSALTWLPPKLANWSLVATPDLQGNPWQCNCRLQWLLDTLVQQLYRTRPALLEDLRCASPRAVAGRRLVHWFNHTGRALCDGDVMADLQSAGAAGTITFKMSPASLAVIVSLGVVAVGLVLLGILAHRKYIAKRRTRNRRF